MNASERSGKLQRTAYLIDRFQVVNESGGGWRCACADFSSSHACRHTREAAGRRAAQALIKVHVAAVPAGSPGERLATPRHYSHDR